MVKDFERFGFFFRSDSHSPTPLLPSSSLASAKRSKVPLHELCERHGRESREIPQTARHSRVKANASLVGHAERKPKLRQVLDLKPVAQHFRRAVCEENKLRAPASGPSSRRCHPWQTFRQSCLPPP